MATIKQEYYLKRRDGTIFKGSLDLIKVSDNDRDAFEVKGLKGRYIVASTDIPVRGLKRGDTPDELIEEYEEVSREQLDAQEKTEREETERERQARKEKGESSRRGRRAALVKYFKSGDLYNKNKDLFILKEGFDPDSVG